MSTHNGPRRAHAHGMRPVTVIRSGERLEYPAAEILSRIQRIIAAKIGPAYLFVDRDGDAYVLTSEQARLPLWLRDRFAEYVGCYARVRRKGESALEPTLDGLCEDIAEHLRGLNADAAVAGCAP